MKTNLLEQLRPRTLSDVAGYADIVGRLESLHEAIGFCGQAFFITGKSGCGKTTIARIIASMVSDPNCIDEIDAQDVTLDHLRNYEERCAHSCLFGDGYSLIINECHTLSSRCVSRLLTMLESPGVTRRGCVIFTTTDAGVQSFFDTRFDSFPLVSRCIVLELNPSDADYQAMAVAISKAAAKYKLGNVPADKCEQIIRSVKGSMRAAIQAVVSGNY